MAVIELSKGQNAPLTRPDDGPVHVVVAWKSPSGACEIDVSALLLGENKKVRSQTSLGDEALTEPVAPPVDVTAQP